MSWEKRLNKEIKEQNEIIFWDMMREQEEERSRMNCYETPPMVIGRVIVCVLYLAFLVYLFVG